MYNWYSKWTKISQTRWKRWKYGNITYKLSAAVMKIFKHVGQRLGVHDKTNHFWQQSYLWHVLNTFNKPWICTNSLQQTRQASRLNCSQLWHVPRVLSPLHTHAAPSLTFFGNHAHYHVLEHRVTAHLQQIKISALLLWPKYSS